MKTLIAIIMMATATLSASAADAATRVATAVEAPENYFDSGFSLQAFGGVKTDLKHERSFYGFGAQYFANANLGFGVYTSMENLSGKTIDNISPQVMWRVPLGRHAFIFGGGVTRTFHDEMGWELNLGPIYSYAITKNIRPFVGVAYNLDWENEEKDPYATVRGGIDFAF